MDDHVDIAAPGHLPHAPGEIVDRQPYLPRPGLIAEQRQSLHPEAGHSRPGQRQSGDARRSGHRRECQHRQLPATEDSFRSQLPQVGLGFGGRAGQEFVVDVSGRAGSQFDRRRETVAEGRMGAFDDDCQTCIAEIGGESCHEFSSEERCQCGRRSKQQRRPRPPRRFHAPVDRQRNPEEGHGRQAQPCQRFHPDPATGLPPKRRKRRLQDRHVGSRGRPICGVRCWWIDGKRHGWILEFQKWWRG